MPIFYSNGAAWVELGVGAPVVNPPGSTAPTAPPPTFTATASNSQVACTWSAVQGATGYRLRLNETVVYEGALLSRTLTGLDNGTPYTLTVSAFNTVGEGPTAPPVVATPTAPDVPPYDADLGTIGNRPALHSWPASPSVMAAAMPTRETTGPRVSSVQTLTKSEALAAILAAPVEADGYRYLRRATITGGITLSASNHTNLVFEDCTLIGQATYTLQTFWTTGAPSGRWPEFRYCTIRGTSGSSYPGAVVNGFYFRLLRCRIEYGIDQVKLWGRNEMYACWLGNGIKSGASHSDTVQVQQGTDMLVHWCTITGQCAPDSPDRPGGVMDRGIQTGGLLGGGIQNLAWLDNWIDGGNDFTLGMGVTGPPELAHWFRRNKFGRLGQGATTGARGAESYAPDGGPRFDSSNVFADTGSPV